MTQQQYVIRRKVNILELGETLGNISEACRRLGVSRQHYYDIKSAIETEGLEGLLEKSRSVPRIGNRVAPDMSVKCWTTLYLGFIRQFNLHAVQAIVVGISPWG